MWACSSQVTVPSFCCCHTRIDSTAVCWPYMWMMCPSNMVWNASGSVFYVACVHVLLKQSVKLTYIHSGTSRSKYPRKRMPYCAVFAHHEISPESHRQSSSSTPNFCTIGTIVLAYIRNHRTSIPSIGIQEGCSPMCLSQPHSADNTTVPFCTKTLCS